VEKSFLGHLMSERYEAMSNKVITVDNLSKCYLVGHDEQHTTFREMLMREARNFARKTVDLAHGRQIVQGDKVEEFWALKDVSFEVQEGDVLGIIGRNGAGKSTLLKILSRITEPTRGRVAIRGRVASLLEVGTGFHPELTGRENIYLNGAILGMTKQEIRKKFDEIVAFAEVERFLDTPVKRYSSGMYVRLAFAVAAHLEPEILIVDEVLSVGDAAFQRKCLGKMSTVATQQGRTILLVSHNMPAILSVCSKALFLDGGQVRVLGDASDSVRQYLKEVTEVSNISLNCRTDRTGNGAVRFVRAYFANNSHRAVNEVRSGDDITIALDLQNNTGAALTRLHVSVAIRDASDEIICYFNSTVQRNDFEYIPFSQLIRIGIRVPKFQLVPGRYSMTLYSEVRDDLADWIREAVTFEVQPGDYYGTGKLPGPGQGQFLADYTFCEMTDEKGSHCEQPGLVLVETVAELRKRAD
jgi:lipopolysaccharide transport system ATP-binding protein